MASQQMINNRYKIMANIGADKSGYFLTLQDTNDGKTYYTKLVKIDNNSLSAKTLYSLQMRMQRLTQISHSNIISVNEPELAEEGMLIRQTDLPGSSLKGILQKQGRPLPLRSAYRIALDIATALAALHSEGLVHGELDPSHVWVDNSGKNYLSFLELPPAFDADQPIYEMPDLTPQPEGKPDKDIFAFGVLLLEMCTAISPYRSSGDGTDVEEYSHVFAYYRECINESVGLEVPELVSVLSRCLTDNKAQRFKNGEELYWAIRELVEKKVPKKEMPEDESRSGDKKKTGSTKKKTEKKQNGFDTGGKKKKSSILPWLMIIAVLIGTGVYLWLNKPDFLKDLPRLPQITLSADKEETPVYEQTLSLLHMTQTAMSAESSRKTEVIPPTETPEPTQTPTPEPTATEIPRPISPALGRSIQWNADGSVMAAVPSSSFTMGMDNTFLFELPGVLPSHRVSLDPFWIDTAEVTQRQYAECVADGVCQPIERIADEWIGDDLPIMNVRWSDAQVYCTWAGKRLPTEAEWEKAARGSDNRLYPWGNASRSIGEYPNKLHRSGDDSLDLSPYGVRDMAGNVSEWVNDYFSETRLISDTEMINPIGPISGNMHTIKGGNFLSPEPEAAAFTFSRSGAAPDTARNYGFRCAVSADQVDTSKAAESETLTLASAIPEIEQPEDCTNRARFVGDITIPDGTVVQSGQWITKTWELENYGTCPWSENYKVVWSDENYTNDQKLFDIGTALQPGESAEISVTFPVKGQGSTHISFVLADTNGVTFGMGPQSRGDLFIEYNVE
ncbi:MAG: SUMF1/EgtB/PvdO family nonheme iron enzyme [Anaerolineaceae bacterium]|nr:SUMF1/EgtB/PvdO family nonheme iron enzyme [Anaerolineaceae bacterium]